MPGNSKKATVARLSPQSRKIVNNEIREVTWQMIQDSYSSLFPQYWVQCLAYGWGSVNTYKSINNHPSWGSIIFRPRTTKIILYYFDLHFCPHKEPLVGLLTQWSLDFLKYKALHSSVLVTFLLIYLIT